MKHTKGLWKITQWLPEKPKYWDETLTTIVDSNNCNILNRASPVEEAANACLIVAAPELLEACNLALSALCDIDYTEYHNNKLQNYMDIIVSLKKAIARAGGRDK